MYKYSIIIIIKNTKKYLSKCLDSVVNQTFRDFEIIIVDDCSDESSQDIVKQYQSVTFPLQYIYLKKSIGPGGARNRGLEAAKGDYVLFIDSDDWIDVDCLQKATPILEQYQADIGMYSLVRNYDMMLTEPYYKCKYDDIQILNGITAFKIMSGKYDFGITISPSPVNKIYKRNYLIDNKITFLEEVYYEDIFWGFRTLLANGKVVTIPITKYHHYKRMGSIVQSLSEKHFNDLEKIFIIIKKFMKEQSIYDEYAFDYYKIFERFYNLLIRQIFEFSQSEEERKRWLIYSFHTLKKVVSVTEYMTYFSAEEIRRHLQPHITDTTLR